MVEAKDHHRIGVGQNTIIDRQFLPGLIDPLIYRNRFAGNFLGETLKPYGRQMKQLQCACNALQEHLFREFRRFITRPRHAAHFRYGRKAIVQLRYVAIGLPRIAPGPIDAEPSFPRDILPRHIDLVVGSRRVLDDHIDIAGRRFCRRGFRRLGGLRKRSICQQGTERRRPERSD